MCECIKYSLQEGFLSIDVDFNYCLAEDAVSSTVEDQEFVISKGFGCFEEHDSWDQSQIWLGSNLPSQLGGKEGLLRSLEDLGRIGSIEDDPADVILESVTGLG